MSIRKSNTWNIGCIYDPATGDTALMKTLVSPETYLAPEEYIPQQKTDGNYQSGTRWRLQFASSDWDSYDTIKGFEEAGTLVRAVAAASSKGAENLQWYESVKVKIIRSPKARRADGDSFFICEMIYEGDENAAIFTNVNLLHQANVNGVTVTGFVDENASGLADGYVLVTMENSSFANGVQNVVNSASFGAFDKNLVFPISDIELVLSAKYTLNSGIADLSIRQENFLSATISEHTLIEISTQRESTNCTTESTAYRFKNRLTTKSSAYDVDIEKPCMRTDGSSEYIAG